MQEFINKQFFHLTIFTLVFGVIFYNTVEYYCGFTCIDEICASVKFSNRGTGSLKLRTCK
jgi:hypothetical protein